MKICYISTVHPLNDNRVFHKMAVGTAAAGHDVHLIIKHERDEHLQGVAVHCLQTSLGRRMRMLALPALAFKKALALRADVYHFHDPELIPVGLLLKALGKRVIYDVHENVAQQLLNKKWVGPLFLRKLVSQAVRGLERIGMLAFDGIVTARPDIAEHFPSVKTRVIFNSAKLSDIYAVPTASQPKTKPVVIYAGAFTRIRGIYELVQAMALVKADVELWLIGFWHDKELKPECEALEGWKRTRLFDYMTVDETYAHMKQADVGIVTFLPAPNHLTTISTKPFEYMACGMPVIMSDFPYWRQTFTEYAEFVNPADPVALAEKIDFLLQHPKYARDLVDRAKSWMEAHYSWEREEQKLLALYRQLERGKLSAEGESLA